MTFSWNSLSVYSVVYTETKAVFLIPELGLCTVTVISYYFRPLRFFLSSIIDRAMNAINQRNNKEKIWKVMEIFVWYRQQQSFVWEINDEDCLPWAHFGLNDFIGDITLNVNYKVRRNSFRRISYLRCWEFRICWFSNLGLYTFSWFRLYWRQFSITRSVLRSIYSITI